jgi:ribosome-binding factor A
MPNYKLPRLAEDMRRELWDIMRSLKDPRITGMLSIVKLDLSRDLSCCKVYVSAMEGLETAKSASEGLNSAAGLVRRELSNRLRLRRSPELRFIADDSIAYSSDIMRKLDDLSEK